MIVEVEAYGGPPDGPWPDAASHSFRGPTRAQHGHVRPGRAAVHLPQPRHSRLRQRRLRLRRCRRRGAAAGRGGRVRTAIARGRRGDAVRPAGAGPRARQSVLGAGNHDGRQRNRPFRCPQPGPAGPVRPSAHRPTGRASGVSQAADRPWRFWLAGRPEVSAVSPQSAGTGARAQRLIREDRVHGNGEHPRRVGLAGADRTVDRPRCAGRRAGRGTRHRLFGIRPDRAESARRPPHPAADAASVPAGRPPADRAGRRSDRNDRRSQGHRRTHAERRAHRRRLGRPHPRSARTLRRLRRLASPAPSSRTT